MFLKELTLVVGVAIIVFVALTVISNNNNNCIIILTGESFKIINCEVNEQLGQLVSFLKVHRVLTNKLQ
uniref:Movement protein TGBp3 n=1 Tax=Hibiscus chlorotic speck associated virus 2 TaxID=3143943 RepID=A0AAU7L1V6_9VIRU